MPLTAPLARQVTSLALDALLTDVRSVDSAPTADGGLMILVTGVLTKRVDTSAGAGAGANGAPGSSPRGALSSPTSSAAAAAAAARSFAQTFFLAPQESGFFVAIDIMRFIEPPPATPSARAEVPVPISLADLSLGEAAAAAAAAASPASPGTPPQIPVQGSAGRGGSYSGGYGGGAAMTHAMAQQQQQQQWQQPSYDTSAYGSYAAMQAEHARAYGLAAAYGPYAAYYAGGAHPAQMGLPPMRHERSGGRSRAPPAYATSAPVGGGDDTASIFVRRLPSDVTPAQLEEVLGRFGQLKGGVNGVTLKSSNNRHFAFIEFETRDAAAAAAAAHVEISGRAIEVEPKRPMSAVRGRGRGRGRGGYGAFGAAFGGREGGVETGEAADNGALPASQPPPPPPPGEADDSSIWPPPGAE